MLCIALMFVYGLSIGVYLAFVVYAYRIASGRLLLIGWTFIAAFAALGLTLWITIVNLVYLLLQITIAIENVSMRDAWRPAWRFVRAEFRELAGGFAIVFGLVVVPTFASALAWSG